MKSKLNLVRIKIEYLIWVLKKAFENDPDFEKKFFSEKYHELLMSKVMDHLKDKPKYDPEKDDDEKWFVGEISENWEELIDAKIEEKRKEKDMM